MAQYIPESLYIASIYPGVVEPQRRNYGPSRESTGKSSIRSTLFSLEPVERGKAPFILEIIDSFEDVLDVLNTSSERGPHKPKLLKPVPVQSIVNDLLARWTGGLYNVP